jgi:hypothetical protein
MEQHRAAHILLLQGEVGAGDAAKNQLLGKGRGLRGRGTAGDGATLPRKQCKFLPAAVDGATLGSTPTSPARRRGCC